MKINTLLSAFFCLVIVATTCHALDSEKPDREDRNRSVPSLATQAQPPQWDFLFQTTWLPGSRIDGNRGDLTMEEVNTGFGRRFSINSRLELSAGLRYSLRHIDAPEAARLPESLHTLSANMGGTYRTTDNLTLGFNVSPGLNSDFKAIGTNDIRVPVAMHFRYQASEQLSLLGGLALAIGEHELPVLPIIGAIYRPCDKWIFTLGFPRTAVSFKPNKTTEYYIGGEFSGGEYRLHDARVGADIISYRDYRALAGIEWAFSPAIKIGISGGYSFGRKFNFHGGARDNIDVNDTPFGRLEFKILR